MKIEIKTAMVILITLLIGILIGFLLTGAVIRHRAGRFASMREPGRMVAHLERMIEPDASQREAVHQVLLKHSEQFSEIHSRFEGQMLTLRDSLKKDLDPILTEEQKERLERGSRHPGPFKGKGRRPGPPSAAPHRKPPPPEEE
jgi:hypothetical protein